MVDVMWKRWLVSTPKAGEEIRAPAWGSSPQTVDYIKLVSYCRVIEVEFINV